MERFRFENAKIRKEVGGKKDKHFALSEVRTKLRADRPEEGGADGVRTA